MRPYDLEKRILFNDLNCSQFMNFFPNACAIFTRKKSAAYILNAFSSSLGFFFFRHGKYCSGIAVCLCVMCVMCQVKSSSYLSAIQFLFAHAITMRNDQFASVLKRQTNTQVSHNYYAKKVEIHVCCIIKCEQIRNDVELFLFVIPSYLHIYIYIYIAAFLFVMNALEKALAKVNKVKFIRKRLQVAYVESIIKWFSLFP